jgi:SAM-dependent methyltransferase
MTGSGWSEGLADWWRGEVHDDPAYREIVTPLILDLVGPPAGGPLLDLGCGEGRVMRSLARAGWSTVGADLDMSLLAGSKADVFRADVSRLSMVRDSVFRGVVISLVLEHLPSHAPVLAECRRVVAPGGFLVLVVNHPTFTAPGAAPVVEGDGETLWRPGEYFSDGFTDEPADDASVRFHHRTMASLLNAAAEAGWCLERMVEQGPSGGQISQYPALADQRHIPRLLGARWRAGPTGTASSV